LIISLKWQLMLLGSVAAIMIPLFIAAILQQKKSSSKRPSANFPAPEAPIAFLFERSRMIDATELGRRLLATGPRQLKGADRLVEVLRPVFPELPDHFSDPLKSEPQVLRDSTSGATLTISRSDVQFRLIIENFPPEFMPPEIEPITLDALDRELDFLQSTIDNAPTLIWQEDETGAVKWANQTYLDCVRERSDVDVLWGWPLPKIFPDRAFSGNVQANSPGFMLDTAKNASPARTFEVIKKPQGELTMCYATPNDQLVRAEQSLHEFVQTLSRTFADLPMGLAIFDKHRQLALFNPALINLTTLEPIQLVTRPHLSEFLDALRNKQRMPEPKNYKSWRDRIASLERAAEDGSYLEDWLLPTGQTFRVNGQPHPNGGIAFLFEDISAEISLTRSFREELELGQAVLDSVDEAIAVFSATRTMIMANAAYHKLWGDDPSAQLEEVSADTVLTRWIAECRKNDGWDDIRSALLDQNRSEPERIAVRLKSGRSLVCRVAPLAGNARLVGFSPNRAAKAPKLVNKLAEAEASPRGSLSA
jgi:PAS domain-containing protein